MAFQKGFRRARNRKECDQEIIKCQSWKDLLAGTGAKMNPAERLKTTERQAQDVEER
jgi:hypothetical protein